MSAVLTTEMTALLCLRAQLAKASQPQSHVVHPLTLTLTKESANMGNRANQLKCLQERKKNLVKKRFVEISHDIQQTVNYFKMFKKLYKGKMTAQQLILYELFSWQIKKYRNLKLRLERLNLEIDEFVEEDKPDDDFDDPAAGGQGVIAFE